MKLSCKLLYLKADPLVNDSRTEPTQGLIGRIFVHIVLAGFSTKNFSSMALSCAIGVNLL
jgi:hypothetical protein